jgi:hypothetical protein
LDLRNIGLSVSIGVRGFDFGVGPQARCRFVKEIVAGVRETVPKTSEIFAKSPERHWSRFQNHRRAGLFLNPLKTLYDLPVDDTFKPWLTPKSQRVERPMALSKTIAGLIGPTLIAAAIAILFNLGSVSALVDEASHEPGLIMVSGILLFIAGLSVVRVHNRWAGGWPVIVTILGWLFAVGGLARFVFPTGVAGIAVGVGQNITVIASGEALILLLVGALLSFKAYRQE